MKRVIIAAVICVGCGGSALAAAASTHYQINESTLGGSGSVGSGSANYKADSSFGVAAINGGGTSGNNSASSNYQTNGGYVTTNDPALSLVVDGTAVNLGSLSTATTSTGTSTFSIINYTSYGYVVQVVGPPPTNGLHPLSGMSTADISRLGVEQFGINLRANTAPTTFGANPSGGVGVAASGYSTLNTYKYSNGDTIASAPKSSGQTNYTISYIANDSVRTPGGTYSGGMTLVCTGTY